MVDYDKSACLLTYFRRSHLPYYHTKMPLDWEDIMMFLDKVSEQSSFREILKVKVHGSLAGRDIGFWEILRFSPYTPPTIS